MLCERQELNPKKIPYQRRPKRSFKRLWGNSYFEWHTANVYMKDNVVWDEAWKAEYRSWGAEARPSLLFTYYFVHPLSYACTGGPNTKSKLRTTPATCCGFLREAFQCRLAFGLSCSQAIVFHWRLCALLMSPPCVQCQPCLEAMQEHGASAVSNRCTYPGK